MTPDSVTAIGYILSKQLHNVLCQTPEWHFGKLRGRMDLSEGLVEAMSTLTWHKSVE